MDVERARWMERIITRAFADPLDAAALSHRFAKHGEDKQLSLAVWLAVATQEADTLARRPRFREITMEVSDTLPGLMPALHTMANQELGVCPPGRAVAGVTPLADGSIARHDIEEQD